MLHRWSEVTPDHELELDLGRRRPDPLPLALLVALETQNGRAQNAGVLDAIEHVHESKVRADHYQRALAFADELELEAPAMLDRCRVRHAIADYLDHDVYPYAYRVDGFEQAKPYLLLSQKLRDARPIGAYGVDVDDEELRERWANRAGLVKLCPDDARAESQRSSKLYGQRIAELDAQGYVLRSAVFTLPNVPQWHLGAGMDSIFDRFKQTILYARVDGRVARSIRDTKRRFPDLVGAWACLEAPLSGLYYDDRSNAWNVHLNLLLVSKPSAGPYGRPDYAPLNEAWGAGIRWRTIPQGNRDAMRHAILELVKYPLQTVASKSAKDRPRKFAADGRELTPAPPMIEWPAEFFCEWWRAHKGFRRTRSWGLLYRGALPDVGERNLERVDWLGTVSVSPAEVVVHRPTRATLETERARRRRELVHQRLMSVDPGYNAAVSKRDAEAREWARHTRLRDAARARLFLIQGNKFAVSSGDAGRRGLRAARGPPTNPVDELVDGVIEV